MEEFNSLKQQVEDIELIVELIQEEDDESQVPELLKSMDETEDKLESARVVALLSDEYDENSNFIHPCRSRRHGGAGLGRSASSNVHKVDRIQGLQNGNI